MAMQFVLSDNLDQHSGSSEAPFLQWLHQLSAGITVADGHTALELNDPEWMWVVEAGEVDVFTAQLRDNTLVRQRQHLLRVEAGQALFGMSPVTLDEEDGVWDVLAVGKLDTRLIKVRRASLVEGLVSQETVCAAPGLALLNVWINDVSRILVQSKIRQIPPPDCVFLDPGQPLSDRCVLLHGNQAARPRSDVLWVKSIAEAEVPRTSPLRFMGLEHIPVIPSENFFPISKYAWVQADAESQMLWVNTATCITEDPLLGGLDTFHRLVLACIAFSAQQTAESDLRHLKAEADFNRRSIASTLTHLASVLETSSSRPASGLDESDPLLAACRLVGEAKGLTFQSVPMRRKRAPVLDTTSAFIAEATRIARVSRVPCREVQLDTLWWRQDSGPLLAYLAEEKYPVALLPVSGRGYVLHDPVTGMHEGVTADVASRLASKAVMFYTPFPESSLSLRDVLKFGLRDSARDVLTLMLAGVGVGLLALVVPIATGLLFEFVVPAGNYNQLAQFGLVFLAAALGAATFEITRGGAVLRLEGQLDVRIQSALMDRLLQLPVTFFRRYSAGDLAYRAAGMDTIRRLLTGGAIDTLLSVIFSLFSFLLLFSYDEKLALVAMALIGVIVVITSLVSIRQLYYQRELLEMEGRLASRVLQWLTAISKLRVAGAEARAFALWGRDFAGQRRLAVRAKNFGNGLVIFNAVYPILATMGLFASMAARGYPLSVGNFLAFTVAFNQFLVSTLAINTVITSILRAVPAFERVKPLLDTHPESAMSKTHPGQLSGQIEVSHVSFRYHAPSSDGSSPLPGPWVLRDVSLHIRPGEFIAVVGPSGAGKSSLLRLLLGFERPESGSIYYDNQDLASLDLQVVRRQMGVVLQHGALMPGSILDNILGTSGTSLNDAWDAARLVGLDQDIERLPMGMHTVVTGDGRTFSGGQRQRLLIARAIVTKPRLLFFDEATNALDNTSQALITRSLNNLHVTRVVIAHRLSTIVNADRIYVLSAGQVVQEGTYHTLVNKPGPFMDLVKRQQA